MPKLLLLLYTCILTFPCLADQRQPKVKVACMGNSVTYGAGIKDREQNAYPAQLQRIMGESYEVGNYGLSGATLLRKGHRPYHKTQAYQDAIAMKPDIAVIHLGLNDTDPRNWPYYRDAFVADYYRLIDTLRAVNPQVRVLVCRLTPIFSGHPRFKSSTRDWYWQIQDLIAVIARNRSTELVDLNRPLHNRPDLFPDQLHPTAAGAAIMAHTIGRQLSGKYGGLQLAPVFADHMVLQQEMPIPVHGTADAGEEVTLSWGKQKIITKAGRNGQWKAVIPALQAGGPYQLEVATAAKKITLQDILVGEVWLCSGQSNMAFPLQAAQGGGAEREAAQQATDIRLLHLKPLAETGNFAWNAATLDQVALRCCQGTGFLRRRLLFRQTAAAAIAGACRLDTGGRGRLQHRIVDRPLYPGAPPPAGRHAPRLAQLRFYYGLVPGTRRRKFKTGPDSAAASPL